MTRQERREFGVRREDGVVVTHEDETLAIEWADQHGGTIVSRVVTVGPWEDW